MEDYQVRVIEERDALEDKLSKLSKILAEKRSVPEFYGEGIPVSRYDNIPTNLELLQRQYRIMIDYHQVLTQRICLF